MTNPQSDDHKAILDLLDRWITFASNKDVDAVMALYSDDICSFDAIGPLQLRGHAQYRAHWHRCMPEKGTVFFRPLEPSIRVSGDLAVVHFLIRCGLRHDDGSEQASWMRATKQLEKQGGHWRIVHEHFSVPFDYEHCAAQFDLAP
ncbi:nuclear transport factor 2 family protein [Thalassospira sp.]|uniref:YybH family protein n=1 Tax=Thalassospira sp. TaxID=1912094 RepID=UPI00311E8EBA